VDFAFHGAGVDCLRRAALRLLFSSIFMLIVSASKYDGSRFLTDRYRSLPEIFSEESNNTVTSQSEFICGKKRIINLLHRQAA
jgi:hypothetical protein